MAAAGSPHSREQSKNSRQDSEREVCLDRPVWYLPESPLGSAVRYVASSSPKFQWIGILRGKKSSQQEGPSIGVEPSGRVQSQLSEWIRNPSGDIVGQIIAKSSLDHAFGSEEESIVRKVAQEIGELWPE